VLLVDDDATLRKLVAMVLEVLDIDLVSCASGAEALAVLRAAPVQLLITDLMMPGVSGYDLLQALAETPALRGAARVVVFSAGLDAATRARLARLDVWQVLAKPVSVRTLEDCVRAALVPSATEPLPTGVAVAEQSAEGGSAEAALAEAAAIAHYFAGQTALFEAYREGCRRQFSSDLQAGERAFSESDAAALRRLAHNLKSVLRMLGSEEAALQAQALEASAAQGNWEAMAAGWAELSRPLRRWALPALPPAPG
jgi:CheY-like chemotaxis protein